MFALSQTGGLMHDKWGRKEGTTLRVRVNKEYLPLKEGAVCWIENAGVIKRSNLCICLCFLVDQVILA